MSAAANLGRTILSLRQLHEDPRLIRLATTPQGKLVVWALATVLLPDSVRLPVSAMFALTLMIPSRRDYWLVVGGVWVIFDRLLSKPWLGELAPSPAFAAAEVLAAIVFLYAAFRIAGIHSSLPAFFRRYMLVLWHAGLWVAVLASSITTSIVGINLLQPTMMAVKHLAWRVGFVLLSGRRGSIRRSGFVDHLFYCLPVWGGSSVPYGKGYDYLSRHRPRSEEDTAQAQLAGIKLLILMVVWRAVSGLMQAGVYGRSSSGIAVVLGGHTLGLPRLSQVIGGNAEVALGIAWILIFLELIGVTLAIAAAGHGVIGALRLFGYRVFRNTYKPLLATSIVDFWNRFYYYFKELLVEFFFFPVYVRHFKTRPRLRIFAATMAAAFLGNVYYHVLRDAAELIPAGPEEAWSRIAPRAFYAFLLGLGVFVSMLREQERRGKTTEPQSPLGIRLRTLRRIAGVWLFYALIHIWNVHSAAGGFRERTVFFLSLFGIG